MSPIVYYRGLPVDLGVLQERAYSLVQRGQSWKELAARGGYFYCGHADTNALRQALGLRDNYTPGRIQDATLRKLLAALLLDPVDIGV